MRILGFLLLLALFSACQKSSNTPDYFTFTVTDELKPERNLPEKFEVTGDSKLVILTNRFNKGAFIYQQTYFVELARRQMDSVLNFLTHFKDNDLTSSTTNPTDSVIYKIKLNVLNGPQWESHMLTGSRFSSTMTQLITYCKSIPQHDHLYKLKESYYFDTDEICYKPHN